MTMFGRFYGGPSPHRRDEKCLDGFSAILNASLY